MTNYIPKLSFVHLINPLIKLIPFLLLMVLVFLKTDFFIQLVIMGLVFGLYFLAKIPLKNLKRILVTYCIMVVLLFVINWFFEKNPLYVNHTSLSQAAVIGPKFGGDGNQVWTGGFLGKSGVVVSINHDGYHALVFTKVKKMTEKAIVSAALTQNNGASLAYYTNLGFSLNELRTSDLGNNHFYAYFVHWYGVTNYAWLGAFYVANKLLIVILASTIFTATTSVIGLTYALEDILRPLKLLALPVTELAMILSIAIRFIPSLISESFKIMQAQASRGIDFHNGRLKEKVVALTSLIVPLFTIAFIKADDLANAMSARSYNPRYARTRFRTFALHASDVLGFIGIITLIALMYFLASHQFIFSGLGRFNSLVVLGR